MVFLLRRTWIVHAALDSYLRKSRCEAEQDREQYTHGARASCHLESPIRAGSLPRACGRGMGKSEDCDTVKCLCKAHSARFDAILLAAYPIPMRVCPARRCCCCSCAPACG